MEDNAQRMQPVFHPRSVAVVGSKQVDDHRWLRSVLPFKGPKYHVNVDRNEWASAEALGITTYASLMDIPDEVDYVLVSVPANVVPRVLDDCVRKKVKAVHLFTAGFGETGTAEGMALEKIVVQKAAEGNLALVGPNCMGIFNPAIGLRFTPTQYYDQAGDFAFISQSGSQAMGFAQEALTHGMRVSKLVSMGNGIVLDSPDYLDYFAEDDDTHAVGMFLEGLRDGRRFFTSLRNLCQRKPVIIWKVGQTEDAARAVSGHSGSKSTPPAIWDAMLRQCGAIPAESLDDVINTGKALLRGGVLRGPRLGLIAISGGHSTEMASVFTKFGLRVPALTEESYARILKTFDVVGGGWRNPFEGRALSNEDTMVNVLNTLNEDENIDAVVQEISVTGASGRTPEVFERRMNTIIDYSKRTAKPYFAVLSVAFQQPDPAVVTSVYQRLSNAGIPTFLSFASGAQALAKAVQYHQFRAAE